MWWLILLACTDSDRSPGSIAATGSTGSTRSTADTASTSPSTDPCARSDVAQITSVTVSLPWSPHEAQLDVTLSGSATVAAICTLDADPREQHLVEGTTAGVSHPLRLAGLLADAAYTCEVAPTCPTAAEAPAVVPLVTPPEADTELPEIVIEQSGTSHGSEYIVTNVERVANVDARPLVFDRDGRIRWSAHLERAAAVGVVPGEAALSVSGLWPPHADNRMRQLDVFGAGVRYDVARDLPDAKTALFHHDGRTLSDGRVITLEERPHLNARDLVVRAFGVRIVDPRTGAIEFDYHAERGYLEGHLLGWQGNSYHPNWVNLYDVDGTEVVHVSLCGPSQTIAVDVPSGDWRWAFGVDGDFSLVDAKGTPLADDEFPQCQHGLERRDDRLLVYDNGKERGFSRVVEYALDESTMTATKVWDWTRPGWLEHHFGGVSWTAEDHVLITMGHHEKISPSPGEFSRFVEVDPATGEVVWEVRYGSSWDQAFRSELLAPCALFQNARYCGAVAKRIVELEDAFSR